MTLFYICIWVALAVALIVSAPREARFGVFFGVLVMGAVVFIGFDFVSSHFARLLASFVDDPRESFRFAALAPFGFSRFSRAVRGLLVAAVCFLPVSFGASVHHARQGRIVIHFHVPRPHFHHAK